ncbi:MAG: hypothetical protein KDC98_06870 [Planctomycetes bacterium]|nr:hypothetical protein [Planctomycetota bacterium]
MSPEFYRIAHIVGVLMLFLGLGGMLACGGREGAKAPALFPMLHGLGLIVMVVAGIGRAHKVGFGWPSWLLLKIVCWLVIAVLPVFVKRGKLNGAVAVLLALCLGGVALWLAATKPVLF